MQKSVFTDNYFNWCKNDVQTIVVQALSLNSFAKESKQGQRRGQAKLVSKKQKQGKYQTSKTGALGSNKTKSNDSLAQDECGQLAFEQELVAADEKQVQRVKHGGPGSSSRKGEQRHAGQ